MRGSKIKCLLYICLVISLAFNIGPDRLRAQPNADGYSAYPFLNTEYNYLQYYNCADLDRLAGYWADTQRKSIVIAHFGDSHVQPDIYPGELRRQLQDIKGKGGFGMLFPFSIARTYSMVDYRSTHTGSWEQSKSIYFKPQLPLGISGVTCRTHDTTASFTISFHQALPESYRRIRLFYKQDPGNFDLHIQTPGWDTIIYTHKKINNSMPFTEVLMPQSANTITVKVLKKDPGQHIFEFYGMSLENAAPEGLVLHCLGIGGSQYGSLLREEAFVAQLPYINPDLAILDFGTNDYLYTNKIPAELEAQIVQVIDKIRKCVPECTILLTTTMDMEGKGKNISAGLEFAQLIKNIAREQHCAFYDWYWVSGGPHVMQLWQKHNLAQKDGVHLRTKGYILKGQLLADAITNTIALLQKDNWPDTLVFDQKSGAKNLQEAQIPEPATKTGTAKKTLQPANSGARIHKVKSGDTLGGIAVRYHTSVGRIQKLNGLNSSKIRAGQVLKIP